jgi:hypothetical protein
MWGSLGLNTQQLKAGLQKYGRTGVFTYLGLSTMLTTGTLPMRAPSRQHLQLQQEQSQ